MGSASRPGRLLPPGKDPVPIVLEAGWAPEPVWTGAENLAPTGIRFPDRPARSQSLYRLSYPAHHSKYNPKKIGRSSRSQGRDVTPRILNNLATSGSRHVFGPLAVRRITTLIRAAKHLLLLHVVTVAYL
jgi:hypothetical protein